MVTLTGDGCFLMSAMEISTAAREGLPVKFFVLDDQAYHYMQVLQQPAYLRTTATILARLDYAALAQGFGVGYQEIHGIGRPGRRHSRRALSSGAGAGAGHHRLPQAHVRWIEACARSTRRNSRSIRRCASCADRLASAGLPAGAQRLINGRELGGTP